MHSNGFRKREFFSQVMNKGKKWFANYLPILSPDDEIRAFCNQCEDGLPVSLLAGFQIFSHIVFR
ncbi:hypothetical protein Hdeb2414_s0019g00541661 [Helianthus debilis subsp. tardiflorus]